MKKRVGIIFGGKSAEHEVSLQSAKNIVEAIDKQRFEVVLIGIDKQGAWKIFEQEHYIENDNNPRLIAINDAGHDLQIQFRTDENKFLEQRKEGISQLSSIDVIFPIIHGTLGEDGFLQGMMNILDIPYVGCDVLSSALCMDKDISKRLLLAAGIPVTPYIAIHAYQRNQLSFEKIQDKLGLPIFIKPANQGSSVGISKVENSQEFEKAIETAFLYDEKILIEKFVNGREIECAVLGSSAHPTASVCGEIEIQSSFYSYDAKYINSEASRMVIPAKISEELSEKIRQQSIQAFQILGCSGLARIDFFLTENNEIYLNELNTLPGFTHKSMYSKLWEKSGLSYSDLISKLIDLAIERYTELKKFRNI
ncbi:D-alanine--D-alanine ligase [Acinetobacter equi]|uniref:D-alanine--D-alanine ligase n=1 Tax=Acinetobacter equi TaxID=1324350 RepID=A0A0N7GXL2_9GAMM|nr:D-alanine--D-alanine ligase [Acinetobacter equi]ALH95027.1 D-alanine--D-alanine ligase [Acinetobacter equi]